MSTRAIRKLKKLREEEKKKQEQLNSGDDDNDGSNSDEMQNELQTYAYQSQSVKKQNVFALLDESNNNDDNGDNDDNDDNDDGGSGENGRFNDHNKKGEEIHNEGHLKKKKKKKKNTNDKKTKDDLSHSNSKNDVLPEKNISSKKKNKKKNNKLKEVKVDEDLEFLNQEIERMKVKSDHQSNITGLGYGEGINEPQCFEIVSIQKQYLNPENEFKKLFGSSKFLSSSMGSSADGAKKITGHKSALKFSNFVTFRSDRWSPFFNPGLHMVLESTTSQGVEIYQLNASNSYEQMEQQFIIALDSHDPNNLVHILHNNPWHVSTLLQLVEVYKMQGDNDLAQDLLEKAVVCIENSFSPAFFKALQSGRARVTYFPPLDENPSNEDLENINWSKFGPNQQLYHVILKRIHSLGSTGCYMTGLEHCKLLLQLSLPLDACHVLLLIDTFFLFSREFNHFLQFLEEVPKLMHDQVLLYLPNLMFARAIALYQLQKIEESNEAIKEALQLWPMVLTALLDRLGSSINIQQWEPIIRNTIFTDQVCNSPVFSQLIMGTVERQVDIWKQPQIQILEWLKTNVKQIALIKDHDAFTKRRKDLYKNKTLLRNYGTVTSAEVTGKVLPSSLPIVHTSTSSSGSVGDQVPNPFLAFFSTMLPWNRDASS